MSEPLSHVAAYYKPADRHMTRPGWYRELDGPFGKLVRLWHLLVKSGDPDADRYAPGGDTLMVGWERIIEATVIGMPTMIRSRRRQDRKPGKRWR